MNPYVKAVLRDQGRDWTLLLPAAEIHPGVDPSTEDGAWQIESMWTEGNFACDCNRRQMLFDRFPDYPLDYDKPEQIDGDGDVERGYQCGEAVKLVELRVVDLDSANVVMQAELP